MTGVLFLYNGLIVWLMEKAGNEELEGSSYSSQFCSLVWLSFTTLFPIHGKDCPLIISSYSFSSLFESFPCGLVSISCTCVCSPPGPWAQPKWTCPNFTYWTLTQQCKLNPTSGFRVWVETRQINGLGPSIWIDPTVPTPPIISPTPSLPFLRCSWAGSSPGQSPPKSFQAQANPFGQSGRAFYNSSWEISHWAVINLFRQGYSVLWDLYY